MTTYAAILFGCRGGCRRRASPALVVALRRRDTNKPAQPILLSTTSNHRQQVFVVGTRSNSASTAPSRNMHPARQQVLPALCPPVPRCHRLGISPQPAPLGPRLRFHVGVLLASIWGQLLGVAPEEPCHGQHGLALGQHQRRAPRRGRLRADIGRSSCTLQRPHGLPAVRPYAASTLAQTVSRFRGASISTRRILCWRLSTSSSVTVSPSAQPNGKLIEPVLNEPAGRSASPSPCEQPATVNHHGIGDRRLGKSSYRRSSCRRILPCRESQKVESQECRVSLLYA